MWPWRTLLLSVLFSLLAEIVPRSGSINDRITMSKDITCCVITPSNNPLTYNYDHSIFR